MSHSKRKTPICGHTGRSEKKDKRFANRGFRRLTKSKIAVGDFDTLPIFMSEIMNVWAMSKDGKHYWKEMPTWEGGKYMRK